MVYNRKRDFFDYTPINKSDENGLFPQEIHFVFYDKINLWIYELIDNENWILSMLNGQGQVYRTEYDSSFDVNDVCERLSEKYPDAEFIPYHDYEEWIEGYVEGWDAAVETEHEVIHGIEDFEL